MYAHNEKKLAEVWISPPQNPAAGANWEEIVYIQSPFPDKLLVFGNGYICLGKD